MKKNFSTHWKASKQPRKQRKYQANAPKHIKRKLISAHLSKELRQKYKRRAFALRKGDTVKVMVGEFRKKTGKISDVNLMNMKVTIEGLQKTKKEGSKVNVPFNASNLMITELNLDDKKRSDSINKTQAKPIKKEENKTGVKK